MSIGFDGGNNKSRDKTTGDHSALNTLQTRRSSLKCSKVTSALMPLSTHLALVAHPSYCNLSTHAYNRPHRMASFCPYYTHQTSRTHKEMRQRGSFAAASTQTMSAMETAIIMTLLFLPKLERLRVLHLCLYSMFAPGLLYSKTTHHLADNKLGRCRRIPCNLKRSPRTSYPHGADRAMDQEPSWERCGAQIDHRDWEQEHRSHFSWSIGSSRTHFTTPPSSIPDQPR